MEQDSTFEVANRASETFRTKRGCLEQALAVLPSQQNDHRQFDRSPVVSVSPHGLFTPDQRVHSLWILRGHASRPHRHPGGLLHEVPTSLARIDVGLLNSRESDRR
jgi:hypothetical protein